MEIFRTISETRRLVKDLKRNGNLGLVPTMGYLHEGHISLIHHSVEECNHTAVSIFVNPTQFGEGEDYRVYPRDEEGDLAKCDDAAVDFVFIPDVEDMFRNDATVYVNEDMISKYMCGHERPTHFRGVMTVVAKLFNIIQPDIAYFGRKDFQQGRLIQRMARDLDFPLEVKLLPTVREPDGLAMSSRNKFLNDDERKQAVVLSHGLKLAERMYNKGERDAREIKKAVEGHIRSAPLAEIGYIEVRDADNLEPVESIDRPTLVALAVRFGHTRLIDNIVLVHPSPEE